MRCSILLAFNDSSSCHSALECITRISNCPENSSITLLHLFRKPTGSEDLMGKKYMQSAPERIKKALEQARSQLVESGFRPDQVSVKFIETPYPTVADGIIDQFVRGDYNLVVIGRKRMSKAEEFVLGDTSVRLVRALEGTAVLVVKQ
ncbi:MAG: universal stress protein [Desulfatitalea sp.]|nr:universal stress protein [Desulfatitalea sp.]NNK02419.1 universal stress protein [Desulfatitalea sp.]